MPEWLTGNTILSGSLALGLGGMLWQVLKGVPERLFLLVRRRLVVELQITSDDRDAMLWVKYWLSSRARSARTFRPHVEWPENDEDQTPELSVLPGTGAYWLRTELGWCWVAESREKSEASRSQSYSYSLSLNFLRTTPLKLSQFLALCHAEYRDRTTSTVAVYTTVYQEWSLVGGIQRRDMESVVLADGMREDVERDLTAFLGRRPWYGELGVPYRRGYLLTGPPGTGKSSLALALASHFDMRLYILQLSTLSDAALLSLLTRIRGRAVVLLEDVDVAFKARAVPEDEDSRRPASRRHRESDSPLGVTMSGLLNALDGAASPEGRLLIMTSNFPEQLDTALVRAGRVDRHWVLDYATASQARRLYRRFFPRGAAADAFVAWATAQPRPMCDLQERLLKLAWGTDPDVAGPVDGTNRAGYCSTLTGCENAAVGVGVVP